MNKRSAVESTSNSSQQRSTPLTRRLIHAGGWLALATAAQVCVRNSFAICTGPPAGVVSWWRAESDTRDVVGTNHGTLVNGGSFGSGQVGSAFRFDGVNDFVRVPRSDSLDVRAAVTIEFWMKADAENAMNTYQGLVTSDFYGVEIANGSAPGPLGVQFFISTDGGDFFPGTATQNGGGAVISAGQWHHVAGTYNGAQLQLYIDGQPWGVPVPHTGAISPMLTESFVTIGAEDGRTVCPSCVGSRYFNGLIDEPTIYYRALNAAEIQAIYAAGSAGKCLDSNPPPCVPAPSGLVSSWRAEGNASDSVDGNHGTLQGGVSFTAGRVGQAFAFDGTGGRVTVPASANLNVGAGNGFSIEGWINSSTVTLERPIVEWNSVTGGNPYPYGVHLWISVPDGYGAGPGCLYANLVDTAGAFHWLTSAGGLITPNTDQHVALSYDKTSGQALLYLDGVVVASKNLGSFTPQTSYNLYLGSRPGGEAAAYSWAGKLDEISIYNRALTAAEIQTVRAAGSAGKCALTNPPPLLCTNTPAGQVGWWKAESNAVDAISGASGTLQGGAAFAAGEIGQSFIFNGTSSYVEVPDSPSLRLTNELTIEFWVKRQLPFGSDYIVNKGGDWTGGALNYGVAIAPPEYGNILHFTFAGGNRGTVAIDDLNWHHCAVVAHHDDADVTFYVDGVYRPTTHFEGAGTVNLYPSTQRLLIGAQEDPIAQYYSKTLIDELGIYNRRLSAAEIQAIYAAGSAGKCPSPPCVPVPSGLVSSWRAEGNAQDGAGGHNGTLLNGAAFAVGKVGQAFSFDGANDFVSVDDTPDLRFGPTSPMSVEMWVFRTSSSPGQHMIGKRDSCTGSSTEGTFQLFLDMNTGAGLGFGPPGGACACSGQNLPLNTWTHLAGTFDGTTLRLFINGQLVATTPGLLGPANTVPLKIGDSGDCGALYGAAFGGLIDETSIYNRALTADEIQTICAAGSAGKCTTTTTNCIAAPTGLAHLWRGEGDAHDAIGTVTGTLRNGTTFAPGRAGQAFTFDGVNSSISFGNTTGNFGMNDFAVEFWLRSTATTYESVIEKWPFCGMSSMWAIRLRGPGEWGPAGRVEAFMMSDAAGTDLNSIFSERRVNDGAFHHVAMVRQATNLLLYIDGTFEVAGATPGVTRISNETELVAGRSVCTGVDGTVNSAGQLDEISIYHRALTPAEIQAIYAAGSAGKCVPPPPPWLLTGPITNAANGHWYYLLNATNWPAAEEIGVSLGGHLVTINNAAENNWVFTNFTTFGGVQRALWLGLNDSGQENIWEWVSGAPATYVDWAPGEPNSGGGFFPDEDHVIMWNPSSEFPFGSWGDAPSNQLHSAVIEVGPPEPVILNGPITNWMNGHWYYLLNYTNWPAAEQIAVSLGGHLAAINNAEENLWVYDTFSTFGGIERAMWIGLNDSAQEGTWVWVSGEPVTYLNWSPIEPNSGGGVFPDEDHALIWHPSSGFPFGSWNDAPSNQLQYAVAEVAPPAPVIVSQPTNLTVYVGSNATFRVSATGGTPLFYQWRFNGTNLLNRTSSALTLERVQFNNAGPYSVVVSNGSGVVTSSIAILTVRPLPNCVPPPAGLVSWWRGENNLTDGWGDNNGTAFPGIIGPIYGAGKVGRAFSSSPIFVTDNLTLRVTNGLTLEAWINPSSVSGATPRTIISKFDYPVATPAGTQSAYLLGLTNNGRVFFTVSATGSARTNTTLSTTQVLPTNQWSFVVATYDGSALRIYVNGALAGQTNYSRGIFPGTASLGLGAIPSTSPIAGYFWPFSGLLDEASLYNRALSDADILAIYNADVVGKCLVPPTIVTQPQDQAVPLGEDARFTVSVLGSRPLRYQWRFNGTNLAGATNSALVLEKVQTNRVGNYSVFVSNAVGTATSSNAALTLLPAPACTEIPAGAVSWWPGDTNPFDAMGANNISSFSPTTYATGKVDRAFSFNGLSSRVTVPNSASVNFGSNADFSIEMWIKAGVTNAANPNVPLFEKKDGSTAWVGYSLSLNLGRLAFAMGSSPVNVSNVSMFISPGPDLRDGMFHHVAVSVNRTNPSGGNLYVDGQLVLNFNPTPRKGSLIAGTPLYLGAPSSTLSNSYFFGQIDEPALYNRVLSAAEILALRNAGAAGKCKTKPTILVQPQSQRATIGSNVTISVTAAGAPLLRYQWLKSGTAIPSATNSSYTFSIPAIAPAPLPDSYLFSVRVTNLFGSVLSSNAVLTVNYVPRAFGLNVTLDEDSSTNLLISASDQDFDPLTFVIVTPPQHGTLGPFTVLPGDFAIFGRTTYTPATNYHGPDSFTYKVNDGLVDSAPATVNITVLPVNDPPVAQSQSVALDEDTLLALTLNASDAEGDPLTFTVGTPSHGTLTGTPPNLTYQPNTNYFGPDSFTFSVSDEQTNSEIATISLTVRPVNDAPVAKIVLAPLSHLPGVTNLLVIASVGTNAVVYLDGSRSTDVENDPLQFSWSEGTNAFASGMLATNQFAPGLHTITLVVSDGQASGTNSVVLEVQSAAGSVGTLITLIESSSLSRRTANPLLASLLSAEASFTRGDTIAGVKQLQAFQNIVRAVIAPSNPAQAALLIASAQEIIDVVTAPSAAGAAIHRLSDPTCLITGTFQMRFEGGPGRPYFIEASTDLTTWQVIGLARDVGEGLLDFEDVHAAQFPGRFYRVAAP